ncbi:MAG: hypothetical protein ACKVT1_08555 [Dehalococcoidia bacterium]
MSSLSLSHLALGVITTFAPVLVLGTTACADAQKSSALIQPTPTPVATATAPVVIPADELVVVSLHDVTSSAIRYQEEAKRLIADQLPLLPRPGHGGVQLVVGTITRNSFDPANTKLAVHIEGLAPKPERRTTARRPQAPDLTTCQRNPFGRQQCEAKLTSEYNTGLAAATADEAKAEGEYAAASTAWEAGLAARAAQLEAVAGQLRDLPLTLDSAGTDINGALLRAAEVLGASKAPKKLLLVSSDWIPWGKQQEGDLHLPAGTIVKALFYDCIESRDCFARKQAWAERLLAAGAERVIWLDPGSSRLQTNIFEEVQQ